MLKPSTVTDILMTTTTLLHLKLPQMESTHYRRFYISPQPGVCGQFLLSVELMFSFRFFSFPYSVYSLSELWSKHLSLPNQCYKARYETNKQTNNTTHCRLKHLVVEMSCPIVSDGRAQKKTRRGNVKGEVRTFFAI